MRQVAVFARWPVASAVKTRLHSVLGPELAARLHTGMLHDAFAAATGATVERSFIYWADRPAGAPPFPSPAGMIVREQRGANLGARIESAFNELLPDAVSRAVVIGADCPELTAAHLDQAFRELEHRELVLAPAEDGGYSLIGLSRRAPELFREVAWGTESVLSETLERAERSRLRATLLARTRDLDQPADLLAFLARASRAPDLAPHTRTALRAMNLLP